MLMIETKARHKIDFNDDPVDGNININLNKDRGQVQERDK